MSAHEFRKSRRFAGKIPVVLKRGGGTTLNYSADGVYFETEQGIAAGEQIELALMLEHQGFKSGVRLHCQGEVVRVDKNDQKNCIAVAISNLVFEQEQEMSERYMDEIMNNGNENRSVCNA